MKAYPAYKESGHDWLGVIPEHWDVLAFRRGIEFLTDFEANGSFADIKDNVVVDSDDRYAWYVRATDLENQRVGFVEGNRTCNKETYDFLSKTKLLGGELLVTKRGEIGKVYIMPNLQTPATLAPNLYLIRLNKNLFPKFAYLWFKSSLGNPQLVLADKSTTIGALYKNDIRDCLCIFPPLPEQQAITDFLDRKTAQIDTLIAKKQRQIELLQEQRTALINQAVTKGLNPSAPLKDSGVEWLGEIPSHWEVLKIAYFVDKITNGYVGPTRDILVEQGVRYIQSLHIKKNTINFHKPYYVSQEWANQHERIILREDDVLVVQTGAIGEVGIVPKEFDGAGCHALIILRVKPQMGYGKFLLYALTSNYGYHSILSIMTGALHPHLNTTYLRDVYLAVPPKNEQQEISKYIESKTQEIDLTTNNYKKTISLLEEYRTALISEAVTGKIDVRA